MPQEVKGNSRTLHRVAGRGKLLFETAERENNSHKDTPFNNYFVPLYGRPHNAYIFREKGVVEALYAHLSTTGVMVRPDRPARLYFCIGCKRESGMVNALAPLPGQEEIWSSLFLFTVSLSSSSA
jgi:hypothetical protein